MKETFYVMVDRPPKTPAPPLSGKERKAWFANVNRPWRSHDTIESATTEATRLAAKTGLHTYVLHVVAVVLAPPPVALETVTQDPSHGAAQHG